jgi:hypothetical protein
MVVAAGAEQVLAHSRDLALIDREREADEKRRTASIAGRIYGVCAFGRSVACRAASHRTL